ncbi:MAG: class I SAM-dependent methyltransferase [Myxococcota bacterium]|nr:class I SAM-dependent methyltransferase [Myxococcota bacterium]
MKFSIAKAPTPETSPIARLLEQQAIPRPVVYELGTHAGYTAMGLLPVVKKLDGMLYCVDAFEEETSPGRIEKNEMLETFLDLVYGAEFQKHVTVIRSAKKHAVRVLGDETADFVVFPQDQTYEEIREDILTWYPKLRRGGLICGPNYEKPMEELDYNAVIRSCGPDAEDPEHLGVVRAVSDFFPDVQQEEGIWYAIKASKDRPLFNTALHFRQRKIDLVIAQDAFERAVVELELLGRQCADPKDAIAVYEQMVRDNPFHVNGYLGLGAALMEAGIPEQATQVYKKALDNGFVNAPVYSQIARACVKLGEIGRAEAYLQASIRHDMAHMPAWVLLIQLYMNQKNTAKAVNCTIQALRAAPPDIDVLSVLSRIALKLGDKRAVETALQLVEMIDPNHLLAGVLRSGLSRSRPAPAEPPLEQASC